MKYDKRVNSYRSGAKNPHRQVLVTELPEGGTSVTVADFAKGRIQTVKLPADQPPTIKEEGGH